MEKLFLEHSFLISLQIKIISTSKGFVDLFAKLFALNTTLNSPAQHSSPIVSTVPCNKPKISFKIKRLEISQTCSNPDLSFPNIVWQRQLSGLLEACFSTTYSQWEIQNIRSNSGVHGHQQISGVVHQIEAQYIWRSPIYKLQIQSRQQVLFWSTFFKI